MGEAKRRKEAEGRTIVARNVVTGERVEMRCAGDPLALRESFRRRGDALLDGRVEAARVPCGGCRECCYHSGVDVYPELESSEDLAHLDLERREDGRFYLRKREDGACVHLGPEGCTVYRHRPHACRAYDCRLYALFGVLDRFDGDHVQPAWTFETAGRKGRIFEGACKMAGAIEYKRLVAAGKGCSANDVAEAVLVSDAFPTLVSALDVLSRMSPDDLADALGFDPRTLTPQRIAQAMGEMFGGEGSVVMTGEERKA